VFLTEAGKKTGYGHLMRCLSLVKEFSKLGYLTKLYVELDNKSTHPSHGVHSANWKTTLHPKLKTELQSAFGLIIDSFQAKYQKVDELVRINPKIAFIDDWTRREYKKGIVIDWTISAEDFAYPQKSTKAFYLLGNKYCAIREELMPQKKKLIKKSITQILLIFGGSDHNKMTEKVSQLLKRFLPAISQCVVFGPGVDPSVVNTFRKTKEKNIHIYHNISPLKMRHLMQSSDLAISAGGQTLYELAFLGLPTLCIQTAENQLDDIRGFRRKGVLFYMGKNNEKGIYSKIISNTIRLRKSIIRRRISLNAQKLIDGQGARRIASFCKEKWSIQ